MDLGEVVKMTRTEKGYSRKELAEKAGISVGYLGILERSNKIPITTFIRIMNILKGPLSN